MPPNEEHLGAIVPHSTGCRNEMMNETANEMTDVSDAIRFVAFCDTLGKA